MRRDPIADARFDLVSHAPEHREALLVGPVRPRGVGKRPVQSLPDPRDEGTALVRIIADVFSTSHGLGNMPSIVLDVWPLMSMFRSAIARVASGLTEGFSVPALPTSKRSPASARRSPSAI